jgi:hypothetical protein
LTYNCQVRPLVRLSLLALVAAPTAVAIASPEPPPARAQVDENPCLSEQAAELRCPDLLMKRPFGLYVQRTRSGRRLLRAGNSIDSIGKGPAELHGARIGRRWMRAEQWIRDDFGGYVVVSTGARLYFKYAHLGRRYWKMWGAARFELWRLDRRGRRRGTRPVRRGPKVSYCLRDLRRTHPRLPGSPRRPVYPACSTSPVRGHVTLGTSVGWSDIYPPTYPEQWIDVTGLRGCFAYVHIADPRNGIYESNERNNAAQLIVRLPFRRSLPRGGCRGRATGEPNRERGPY